ncbi:RecX family transcriptional regulator [Elizabethkingia argentiflava]|uniref:Regulatory protein RecX n=1 Tax=Elizabethkingia argenteiflava TaxID=2681556 RepID=A0A845PSZ6_9FLAO|nr:regulatory protein RecX [Elizabethkingia argenteiflava]NAW51352.1 RecX family transcriptional regulator [Elizabethkingia argenteiflava]
MHKTPKNFTFQQIRQKLINYCIYQDRCHVEVEEKMKEFFLVPEARDEILLYLIRENYLNEERFTRSYIRGKFYIKHWGKLKITNHLKAKKISEKLILMCMDEIDDRDYMQQVRKMVDKILHSYSDLSEYHKKHKIMHFLMSKGYEYETIIKIIQQEE